MRTSPCLRITGTVFAMLACSVHALAQVAAPPQTGWLRSGAFIGPGDLPPDLAAALQKLGGRMMSANKANTTIAGTVTDASGSRPATIIVQAPGYLRYTESGSSRVVTFDGSRFNSKSGPLAADDVRVAESLLASFPDMVFLQLARKGFLRRVGSGFRTDDGRTPNYAGPWWTVYAFGPGAWQGLSTGQPLQQEFLIAIDAQTWLLSEVRVVDNLGAPDQKVTQTQFSGWFQQGDQWFPGTITRLENGQRVLSFQSKQAAAGPQAAVNSITAP